MARRAKSSLFGVLLLLLGTGLLVKSVADIFVERLDVLMPYLMGLGALVTLFLVLKIKRAFSKGRKLTPEEKTQQLRSWKWKRVRYEILRQYGRRCMLCGATEGSMHVDHIKPRSKYPELAFDRNNLQVLCEACNIGKSNAFEDDFRARKRS